MILFMKNEDFRAIVDSMDIKTFCDDIASRDSYAAGYLAGQTGQAENPYPINSLDFWCFASGLGQTLPA